MNLTVCRIFALGCFLPSVLFAQPSGALPRDRYLTLVPVIGTAVARNNSTAADYSKSESSIVDLPKRNMTFAEIAESAAQNHPGVLQARHTAEALRGAWIQAGLQANPTLEFSSEEITEESSGIQGISISQPIIPKYKRAARQAAVSKEYQAALQVYQIQCRKAVNDAMLTAYRSAFAYRKCVILEHLTQIAEETLRTSGKLLQAQETERSAFLEIKIEAQRTRMDLRDTEISYRTASKELAVLLGLPEMELIGITDSIEEMPAELYESDLLSEILTNSPEMQQAYAEVQAAKARLQMQYAEASLEFETKAGIAYNTAEKLSEFSVGIAIPVRIFDRNQGNIRQTQSELAAANRNAERVQKRLTQQLKVQWGIYETARNRVTAYQDNILPEALELQTLAFEAYRRGEYNSHEMLEAQRTYAKLQLEYFDNLHDLMESQILLQGSLLSGALDF